MKSYLVTSLMLLAGAQFTTADDQTKSSTARSHPHVATAAPADAADAPRPVQTVARRQVGNPANPNARGVNPIAASNRNPRLSPTNPNRVVTPSNPSNALAGRDRSRGSNADGNNNRSPVTKSGGQRNGRIPARSGNEFSFSQAQAQCKRDHHNRDWWRHHHGRVCFYGGGYWFWNAGWWFPAWGYDPFYNNYVYDGPIYGFGQLSPGDVTAQVQEVLAEQGYYYGPLDGVLGPETRDALLRFQADHGLAATAAIDEPTLDTLGLT